MTILVDSTGLSVHVGSLRKPPKNRDWRKLHVSVNALTGDVIACDLTSKSAPDASRVPVLLRQIESPLASACADGAYDKDDVWSQDGSPGRGRCVLTQLGAQHVRSPPIAP